MDRVLITGITGFLGSHIAKTLVQNGFQVIGLKRPISDTWRCKDFFNQIEWIDVDQQGNWKELIIQKEPKFIIHCAWIGVEAKDRNNWTDQIKNIFFLNDLIEIVNAIKLSKFVFIGSQSEYGEISGKITEQEIPHALNAYSGIKLACLEIMKAFCESNQVNLIWLRLFSVFGEKENQNWLIPQVINKMLYEKEMDFTACDQKYAYLYVDDFAKVIMRILSYKISSGIYNISSNEVRPLKRLIEQIRDLVNPDFKLNFGALPYRKNQSMHLEGDISKLTEQLGELEFTDFNIALQRTVKSYMSK